MASRGLDVKHVTHVVNFAAPRDTADYTHRIGRTGRAGREGTAITFVTPSTKRYWRDLLGSTQFDVEMLRNARDLSAAPAPRGDERGARRGDRSESSRRPRRGEGEEREREESRERPRRRRREEREDAPREDRGGRSRDEERPRRRRGGRREEAREEAQPREERTGEDRPRRRSRGRREEAAPERGRKTETRTASEAPSKPVEEPTPGGFGSGVEGEPREERPRRRRGGRGRRGGSKEGTGRDEGSAPAKESREPKRRPSGGTGFGAGLD